MPTNLAITCTQVVDDCRAFCREKHGDSPEALVLRVTASTAQRAAGVGTSAEAADGDGVILAPFVAFSLHELLKNAMGAHVRSVGADRLDRLRPIEVRHGVHDGKAFVGITDFGGGWAEAAAPQEAAKFLHTTNVERMQLALEGPIPRSHTARYRSHEQRTHGSI